MLHDNLEELGNTHISGRYLHLALVGGYLARPGRFHTVGEDGRLSKAFRLNDAVTPEVTLAVDALALLVWWPQFRAHHYEMLRLYERVCGKNSWFRTCEEPLLLKAHAFVKSLPSKIHL